MTEICDEGWRDYKKKPSSSFSRAFTPFLAIFIPKQQQRARVSRGKPHTFLFPILICRKHATAITQFFHLAESFSTTATIIILVNKMRFFKMKICQVPKLGAFKLFRSRWDAFALFLSLNLTPRVVPLCQISTISLDAFAIKIFFLSTLLSCFFLQ